MSPATRSPSRHRSHGTVVSLAADDTQRVEAGQELVRLDATDARLQLQRAAAVLAQSLRSARQQAATAGQFDALTQQRDGGAAMGRGAARAPPAAARHAGRVGRGSPAGPGRRRRGARRAAGRAPAGGGGPCDDFGTAARATAVGDRGAVAVRTGLDRRASSPRAGAGQRLRRAPHRAGRPARAARRAAAEHRAARIRVGGRQLQGTAAARVAPRAEGRRSPPTSTATR